jgi:hypothetical protein
VRDYLCKFERARVPVARVIVSSSPSSLATANPVLAGGGRFPSSPAASYYPNASGSAKDPAYNPAEARANAAEAEAARLRAELATASRANAAEAEAASLRAELAAARGKSVAP